MVEEVGEPSTPIVNGDDGAEGELIYRQGLEKSVNTQFPVDVRLNSIVSLILVAAFECPLRNKHCTSLFVGADPKMIEL